MLTLSMNSCAQRNMYAQNRTATRKPAFGNNSAQPTQEDPEIIALKTTLDKQLKEKYSDDEIIKTMTTLGERYTVANRWGDSMILCAQVYKETPEGSRLNNHSSNMVHKLHDYITMYNKLKTLKKDENNIIDIKKMDEQILNSKYKDSYTTIMLK